MHLSEVITPLLCGISPFALGWILLSLFIGIRTGWEASVRLFLLGLGLLVTLSAIAAILYYLPDWAAVSIMAFCALSPWVSTMRFFIASRFSGKLLMAIPAKHEKWSLSIMSGMLFALFGLRTIVFQENNFLTPAKSWAFGIWMITFGIFRVIQRIRYTQIRETGILSEAGAFYNWQNIESYGWKFGDNKLSIKLKKAIFNKKVNLKILSQFRQEVVAHLSQNVKFDGSITKGYAPNQKAG